MTTARLPRRDVSQAIFVLAVGCVLGRPRRTCAENARAPIGRYGTAYKSFGAEAARARNIALAAEAIDGRVILPDATFSFNDIVGERSLGGGFERSRVLRQRAIVEGVGGGTCQVASTLHAAALLAGLEIVDRSPHSRPSAYIPMGLDATVAYPTIDLKLRNPWPERLVIRARTGRDHLDVWINSDGSDHPRVSLSTEITDTVPSPREVEKDLRVPPSEVRVRIYGIPGYTVRRTREIQRGGDPAQRDVRVDTYPPVPFRVAVHPSFDLERLGQREPLETHDGIVQPPLVRDEPGVERPAEAQLHPQPRLLLTSGTH